VRIQKAEKKKRMDISRQNSTLALLRRLMPIADPSVPGYTPDHFTQLCDGISLYAALCIVDPNHFPPVTGTSVVHSGGEEATATLSLTSTVFEADAQVRQANLSELMQRIAQYAQEAMGPSSSAPPVTRGLDAAVLAELRAAVSEPLMQLVGVAITLVVLSGVQSVLTEVKALPRQDQVVLSNWVRELMGTFDLKPRRHVAAHANPGNGGSPTHPSGSTSAAVQAAQRSALPVRAAPVPTPASPPFTAAATPPSTTAIPLPTATLVTTFTTPAAVAVAAANESTQPTPAAHPTLGESEDEGYYRNATYQLRNELAEVKAQLAALQDQYRLAKEDKDTAENKYRLLLGEQAKASSSAVESSGENQKEMLALWQERCSKKDETIATLTARVEEQSSQLSALKEAAVAQEMALQTLRRRLKTAEEGLIVKSKEKRDAEEKLTVAEDKLAAQMKARLELENQVEELNSRVLVLTVEQDRLRGNTANDENQQMNSSFASNGSVDRVMTLENELDEMRQQRDSLQRQVGILQRQVAAMPAPVADVSTANDTWRAQLRQVEREREELRQQLTTALARNGDLQQQLAASAAAAATAAVANLSLNTGRPGGNAESANASVAAAAAAGGGAAAALNNSSMADGSELDSSSLNVESPRRQANNINSNIGGKTRDTVRREQVILSSLLLQYSYRNLLLQQHQTLLHKDSVEAETARQHQAEEHLGIARHTPSSLLTKQRRDVEQGLLESVLHGTKLRMMRVEQ
jgi:hypothetical protein